VGALKKPKLKGNKMKKILIAAIFLLPLQVNAEHMDVIQFKLHDDCSFEKYMAIVADFNEWGKAFGYKTKIAYPLQNDDLTHMYWLGTSANAAAFGKAWDAWRDAQVDASSVPAKLQARFDVCETNVSRTGYDIY
jgi:hypothetical protein